MSKFSLTPAQFKNAGTHNMNDNSSVAGYGYYSINISKYNIDNSINYLNLLFLIVNLDLFCYLIHDKIYLDWLN